MRLELLLFTVVCLLWVGCTKSLDEGASSSPANGSATSGTGPSAGTAPNTAGGSPPAGAASNSSPTPPDPASGAAIQPGAAASPVAVASGAATSGPENTKIEFVGTHVGDKPDPRTGGFEKFTGKVELDEATKAVKSVSVDIETDSLWTQIPRLTNHLKSGDFLEVAAHPTAKFVSKKIDSASPAGPFVVTGDLTLHGVTKPVTFPATVIVSDAGLLLTAAFAIDRTEFDMNFGPDKVEKSVAITVAVGQKTQPR